MKHQELQDLLEEKAKCLDDLHKVMTECSQLIRKRIAVDTLKQIREKAKIHTLSYIFDAKSFDHKEFDQRATEEEVEDYVYDQRDELRRINSWLFNSAKSFLHENFTDDELRVFIWNQLDEEIRSIDEY